MPASPSSLRFPPPFPPLLPSPAAVSEKRRAAATASQLQRASQLQASDVRATTSVVQRKVASSMQVGMLSSHA